MTKEQVEEKVINIIVNDLLDENEKKKIDINSKFFEDIDIDSIVIVNLVLLIEERFDISVDDVSELIDCIIQVSDLVNYIYKKLIK